MFINIKLKAECELFAVPVLLVLCLATYYQKLYFQGTVVYKFQWCYHHYQLSVRVDLSCGITDCPESEITKNGVASSLMTRLPGNLRQDWETDCRPLV
jgi:hypothetical protein